MRRQPVPEDRKPYPHPERPGVYCLPLAGGEVALIDAGDAERVSSYLWETGNRPNTGPRTRNYERNRDRRLSRLITGAQREDLISFRNGNPLDCRRSNLLRLSRAGLSERKRKHKPFTSIYKGVYKPKGASKWIASLQQGRLQGRNPIWLGTFEDEKQAARAYDDAAREHFGPHARVNFPEPASAVVVTTPEVNE